MLFSKFDHEMKLKMIFQYNDRMKYDTIKMYVFLKPMLSHDE
jgi:hypothetical protein